jgi:hypothetical protein
MTRQGRILKKHQMVSVFFNERLLYLKFCFIDSAYSKCNKIGAISDSLTVIAREVIELIKMFPKSTMKFNRFIPAYHNHFGKQCRVADYGYTRLIELFEALSNVVQVITKLFSPSISSDLTYSFDFR